MSSVSKPALVVSEIKPIKKPHGAKKLPLFIARVQAGFPSPGDDYIEKELVKAQKEILELKKNSVKSINIISQVISSNIIEKMSGDKLNESSIKAVVEEISKKSIGKYL